MSILLGKSLYRDSFKDVLSSHLNTVERKVFIGTTDENRMKYSLFEFSSGDSMDSSGRMSLHEACTASMSVPGVFPGVDVGSDHFIDGGIVHTLPVEAIQKTIDLAKLKNEPLELVIFSAQPWGWAPKQKHHRFLEIPRELMRLLEGMGSVNLYHDQRMLHEVLSNAKTDGVDVKLSTFMLPAKIVNEMYDKYPPSSYSKCKPETFARLIKEGHDLVKTVLEHTSPST